MNKQPYYQEIEILLKAFSRAFNNIIINRTNITGDIVQKIKVNYVFAPKQRVLHDLSNKAQNIQLPIVAVEIVGISRDGSRQFSKIDGSEYSINSVFPTYSFPNLQPVPINIDVKISIITTFSEDMYQIFSNYVAYCDPYIIVSYKHPYLKKDLASFIANPSLSSSVLYDYQEIRAEIVWNGDINIQYPTDITQNYKSRITADSSFTIKGWIFKEKESAMGKIFKINTNFIVGDVGDEDTEQDNLSLSACPYVTYAYPYEISQNYLKKITLQGYQMENVGAVYLSADNSSMFGTLSSLNPFGALSALDYYHDNGFDQSFNGISAAYTLVNDNTITVQVPTLSATGKFDIILVDTVNASGYSFMTEDIANGNIFSYAYPAVSGISVI